MRTSLLALALTYGLHWWYFVRGPATSEVTPPDCAAYSAGKGLDEEGNPFQVNRAPSTEDSLGSGFILILNGFLFSEYGCFLPLLPVRAPQAGHQAGARRGDLQRAESAGAQRRGAVAVVGPGAGAAAGVRPRLVLPLLHRAEQARHLAVPGILLHQ